MSEIEKIYYNMDNLSDDRVDTPEVLAAYDAIKTALGDEIIRRCEDEIMSFGAEHEKQGFVEGFQYAISLLTCGRKQEVC